jgi:hypothetical protein
MLHITNGDSAAWGIVASGLDGIVLPWRDVLHEGPVPSALSPDELGDVRARFIASRGWGQYGQVLADLRRRDEIVAGFQDHEEIVFWFEHDLYDQLQLIQVLDRFAGRRLGSTRLSMICIGAFPGVPRFCGLGQLSGEQLLSLFPQRQEVTVTQIDLARIAWDAVRSSDPTAVERVLAGDTRDLPFLHGALTRHLEEFPSQREGLSRTERQTLEVIEDRSRTAGELYRDVLDREERPFMGDDTYWSRLQTLTDGLYPLLVPRASTGSAISQSGRDPTPFAAQSFAITVEGRKVVSGDADQVILNGVDRWIGGVHLDGQTVPWRWDASFSPARLRRVA